MSDQTSPQPVVPAEPPKTRGRRGLVAIVGSVVAVLLIAGGGYAAWQFFGSGGPQPAEVLPDSTFAVVSLDLDPSGGQKIEAIKTLRKFPSFREHTGVRPDSDVVKAIWDDTVGKQCTGIDYAQDVKPWIGQRAAFGGVDMSSGKPWPVVALQISDQDAAGKGLTKLTACAKKSGEDDFGYAVGDNYALVSDSTAHAKAIAAAGQKSPLSQDAAYQKWTDASGGPGIMNAYLSRHAADELKSSLPSGLSSAGPQLDKAIAAFKGAGATLQFKDGGLELAVAGGGVQQIGTKDVGDHVAELPKDSAAVIAGAADGTKVASSLEQGLAGLGSMFGALGGGGTNLDQLIEQQTGLRMPDDLVTLLGDSFSLSVGGDAPADLAHVQSLSDIPAGYLVRGDDQAVKDVVDRLQQHTGLDLAQIPATFETSDGKAVLATSPDYAKQLLAKGSLGDSDTFKDVVPHADKSPFVLYLSLDNGWSDALGQAARSSGDKDATEVASDVEALKALGISAWNDGGTSHALVRLTVE